MDPRSILGFAPVFHLFNFLIGARHARKTAVTEFVKPRPGERVLDCGCGTGDLRPFLGDVDYLGIDISNAYIRAARKRYGAPDRFLVMDIADAMLDHEPPFDLVMAFGFLHHLDDTQAKNFLQKAIRYLKPTGRFVSMEPCFSEDQSRSARYLIGKDRGQHPRNKSGYLELLQPLFTVIDAQLRHNLLRIPYTHILIGATAPILDTHENSEESET